MGLLQVFRPRRVFVKNEDQDILALRVAMFALEPCDALRLAVSLICRNPTIAVRRQRHHQPARRNLGKAFVERRSPARGEVLHHHRQKSHRDHRVARGFAIFLQILAG